MKQRNMSHILQRGFTLIEIMIGLGVMSIAGVAILNLSITSMKANKSNQLKMDIQDIRRTITNTIGCDQTLGAARPTTCAGEQVLKDKLGQEIAPQGKIGPWDVQAVCESIGYPPKNGLSIYVTKKRDPEHFAIDPLKNIPFDKKHPSSSLFEPSTRLCAGNFVASTAGAACPNGIKSVNFDDRTFVCAKLNIATCPGSQFIKGVTNDVRTCASP